MVPTAAVLLVLIYCATTPALGQSDNPTSLTQAEGLQATFFCRHPAAQGSIDWKLDGVYLRNIDTSDGTIRKEGRGAGVEVLIIMALSRYNETEIVCITYIRYDGGITVEESAPARLLVQEPLKEVDDLYMTSNATSIDLAWEPPFSLNITGVEPDIIYCVDVINITAGVQVPDFLISRCDVIDPQYSFTVENPDPRDLFLFVVTPRSNIEGAMNGTSTQISESFAFEKPSPVAVEDIDVEVEVDGSGSTLVKIILRHSKAISGPKEPDTYKVVIKKVYSTYDHECPVYPDRDDENVTLVLNCTEIQEKALFKVKISASNSAGESLIADDVLLSTHYVQDVNPTSDRHTPGRVDITCEFIVNKTKTKGYLAVVRSDSNDSDINYLIAENQNIYLGPGVVKSNLTGLRGQNYSTVLYELNGGGLPVEQAASFPKNVSLSQNGSEQGEADTTVPGVFATLSHDHDHQRLAVRCFFTSSAASACVVIYFKNAHDDVYNLVDISREKLPRQNEEEEINGTIKLPNLDRVDYHVAVFAYREDLHMVHGQPLATLFTGHRDFTIPTQETSDKLGVVGAAIGVVLVVLLCLVIAALAVIILYKRRCNKSQSNKVCSRSTGEESTDSTLSTPC